MRIIARPRGEIAAVVSAIDATGDGWEPCEDSAGIAGLGRHARNGKDRRRVVRVGAVGEFLQIGTAVAVAVAGTLNTREEDVCNGKEFGTGNPCAVDAKLHGIRSGGNGVTQSEGVLDLRVAGKQQSHVADLKQQDDTRIVHRIIEHANNLEELLTLQLPCVIDKPPGIDRKSWASAAHVFRE